MVQAKFKPGDILNYQDEIIIIKYIAYGQYGFSELKFQYLIYQPRQLSILAMERLAVYYNPKYNEIWYNLNETSI